MQSISYAEILRRREKRKADEIAEATRRPPIPNVHGYAMTILIHQAIIDSIYQQWRTEELAKAQAIKEVIKPVRRKRGGRRNNVLAQLGLE